MGMRMSSATARITQSCANRFFLLSTVLAAACNSEDSRVGFCAAPRSLAIEVAVTDSASGLALADSAAGSLVAGNHADSLQHVSASSLLLVGGSALGTYDVSVARPGYASWSRTSVAVTQTGQCGNVEPVHLDARLQPAP